MTLGEFDRAVPAAAAPGTSTFVGTNGIRLHAIRAGPGDGPPVVLLHGFPEFWYGWHRAIRPLADAGYRVIVPDQRGYNRSDKPGGIDAYRLDELAADVAGLIDALGHERAAVVGHDWGGVVGWWLAVHDPDRVERLCAVNAPHPTVMSRTLAESWGQRLRSAYVLLFQLPGVPELVSRAGDWRLPAWGMRRTSRPGTFSERDFERYRAAWRQPGAFTAMLNWYRALRRGRRTPERPRVSAPTLVLWGTGDRFLRTSMARRSLAFPEDGTLELIRDATHWVQHERPGRVASRVLDFLAPLDA